MAAGTGSTLLTSQSAVVANGNSGALALPHPELIQQADLFLNVSAAAVAVGDTLDVYVQSSVDGGNTWNDFVHFTQVLGNGGAKQFDAKWVRNIAPTTAQGAPGSGTLAAGVAQGPVGKDWQVLWKIAGTGPNFTFSVSADLVRNRR